jgi:hypothetical protein
MAYEIIQPPFTLNFKEMQKAELKNYYSWFMKIMPDRINFLESYIKEQLAYSSWCADFSPDSLLSLGEWFADNVETRNRNKAEIEDICSRSTYPIDIPDQELTNQTFSIAMDVGMYFGQVILKNLSGTKWDQSLKSAKEADYGQPVILGFSAVPLNPVRIVVSLAYGLVSGKQKGERLRGLYNTWATLRK